MTTSARRREPAEDELEDPPEIDALRRRSSDRLLTVDRALLLGVFSIGVWVATADFRQGDLMTRVAAIERRVDDRIADSVISDAKQDQDIAVIRIELRHIGDTLEKLAASTARLANSVREQP